MTDRPPRTRAAVVGRPKWLAAIGAIGVLGFAAILFSHLAPAHVSMFSAGGIIGAGVLFAGGLPGVLSHRKIRHRSAPPKDFTEEEGFSKAEKPQWVSEKTDAALSWARRNRCGLAVLLIDLNQLRKVNAAYGRRAGDDVLAAFMLRLKAATRAEDTVERLGGDEFVILQPASGQPPSGQAGGAGALASRLMQSLAEPYQIGGQKVFCGASAGVAISPSDGDDWETLLSRADAALHRAKAEGIDTVCFFDPATDADFRRRRRLEVEIARALEEQAFQLAFQPLIRVEDGALIGFEALLRWPAGWEQSSPATFVPVAEETGLIVPIGAWILHTACMWAAAWTKPLKLSVNLSPVQFRRGDIVATVAQALKKSGLDAARLELEVTESLWLQDADNVLDQLNQLRSMGVAITLDDFGTGASSLSCLARFPFNAVKIDRSFVAEMGRDQKAQAMVKSIVALGKTLNLTVTAEGVETQAQAEALIAAGCDRVQGYFYGRPLSATAPILY